MDDLSRALLFLADRDPDGASERNGAGFNSRDTGIGNDLAERILNGQGLSDKQYIAARKILQTYRVQVERGTGIDVTSIPAMRAPSGAVLCRGRGPQQFTQARQPGTCARCRGSVQVGDSIELRPGARGGWDRFHEACPVGSSFETTNAVEIQEPADWWNDHPFWGTRVDPTPAPAAPVGAIVADQADALLDEYHVQRLSRPQSSVSVVSAVASVARSLELPVIQTETGQTARGVLGPGGMIAQHLPGYEHRETQLQAADAIERAIELGGHAVIEAGTGTGKSLAYLVPAINSGRRTMVSTADKSLQAQIWGKDVPFLQEVYGAAGIEVRAALLKGRGNYVCLNRVAGLRDALIPDFKSPEAGLAWAALNDWIYTQNDTEDLADLETFEGELPAELRSEVTTDSENCIGKKCPQYNRCFVERAKQRAEGAQIVIVNHALLLRGVAIAAASDGFVEILPEAGQVILDEAHHLEEIATDAFGAQITESRWTHALRRLERLTVGHKAIKHIPEDGADPEDTARRERAETWSFRGRALGREFFSRLRIYDRRLTDCKTNVQRLGDERELLEPIATELGSLAEAMTEATPTWLAEDERETWRKLSESVKRLAKEVGLAARPDVSELVRYVERERDRIIINVKPVDVAEQLRQLLFGKFKTVVATSATISTGGSMAYWRQRVGCDEAIELEVGSPFNYAENGRLYLPLVSNDFDPTRHRSPELEGAYFERLATEMAQLVGASGGGAFLLFTSNRALRAVYELLEPKLGDRFTLLRQGQASRPRLVEQFKADGNAVLFGVKSFWEGVDVGGDALRLVVIDKFPFAPPDDPVWEARKDKITKETGDQWAWFGQLAVPYTTILIKQAVGRLIRSRSDRGVCVILDGRATGKSYGTRILKALPPMRQTRSMSEVRSFFNGR